MVERVTNVKKSVVTCFKEFSCSNAGSPQKYSVAVVGIPSLDSIEQKLKPFPCQLGRKFKCLLACSVLMI